MDEQPSLMSYVVTNPPSGAMPAKIRRGTPVSSTLIYVCMALVVLLIIIIVYYMWLPKSLSSALKKCGWVMYSLKGCSACVAQIELLGEQYPATVLCSSGVSGDTTDDINCSVIASGGFPTWYNKTTQETRVGVQDLETLAKMAGWRM